MTISGHYRRDPKRNRPALPFIKARITATDILPSPVEVSLLIDTGADGTALLWGDVERLGIDFDAINAPIEYGHGAGGATRCKSVEAVVELYDDSIGDFRPFKVRLGVLPDKTSDEPLPSLLGRDVLNDCLCTFNAVEGRVTLKPLVTPAMSVNRGMQGLLKAKGTRSPSEATRAKNRKRRNRRK